MAAVQKKQKFYQGLFYIIAVVSVLLIGLVIALLIQLNREKQARHVQLQALILELTDAESQTKERQEYLDRLMRDTDFRERVIRERLNRVRPDEIIYHFQE